MNKWIFSFLITLPLCHAQSAEIFEAEINRGDEISPQWKLNATDDCKPVIEASPKGDRVFIGKIPIGKQALVIPKLANHTHVRIQFDLILKGTWDGVHNVSGPDTWKLDVDGREPLVNASFCNNVLDKIQSFPDFLDDSYEPNPQFTNALESSTLGYIGVDLEVNKVSSDSVYRFDFTIPHTKSSIQLNFESKFKDSGAEPNSEQWYGIDNMKVSTVSKPKKQNPKWILSQIDSLASPKSVSRHQARLNLLANDEQFVAELANYLKEKKVANIHKFIPLLNDESYQVREEATTKLQELSAGNTAMIEQALNDATEPEIISRLRFIVKESKKKTKSNKQSEIARLLKMIDTPQAQKLLRTRSLQFQ